MAVISWRRPSARNAISARRRSPTYSCLQQENAAGRDGGWGVRGDVTGTGVFVNHSVEKSLHSVDGLLQLQAYNTDQMTTAIRFHSRPLLVSEGKAVLQLSTA